MTLAMRPASSAMVRIVDVGVNDDYCRDVLGAEGERGNGLHGGARSTFYTSKKTSIPTLPIAEPCKSNLSL